MAFSEFSWEKPVFCFVFNSQEEGDFIFVFRAWVMQPGELKLMLITFRRNLRLEEGDVRIARKWQKQGICMVGRDSGKPERSGDAWNGYEGSESSGHPIFLHLPGMTKLNPLLSELWFDGGPKRRRVSFHQMVQTPSVFMWHGANPYRRARWWL